VNSTVRQTGDDEKPHLPTHGILKINRFVFHRDITRIKIGARFTFEYARENISRLDDEGENPECVNCKAVVSLPCWVCVECSGEWKSGTKPRLKRRRP
jgi:hypothetical protein